MVADPRIFLAVASWLRGLQLGASGG